MDLIEYYIDRPLKIETPLGILEAYINKDPNFPGIRTYLNGDLIAVTEYDEDRIRSLFYKSDSIYPDKSLVHIEGEKHES